MVASQRPLPERSIAPGSKGRCLVHCYFGRSRSVWPRGRWTMRRDDTAQVAVVMAVLLARGEAATVDEALALVRARSASNEPQPVGVSVCTNE